MKAPGEKDQVHGAYIHGALTDGPTFSILSPQEQEICRAAARVAELLATKTGLLPGREHVPAVTFYDRISTTGQMMQTAIINTLTRANETNPAVEFFFERSIQGEILAQGEAMHILAVAEGRVAPSRAGQYALDGAVVGRSNVLSEHMRNQSIGHHYKLPEANQAEIEDSIMNGYHSSEDQEKFLRMKKEEGKIHFIDLTHHDLEFHEDLNAPRVHQMLAYGKSLGNSEMETAIRAVHAQTVAENSALRRANPELGEDAFHRMYDQELQAGARLLNLDAGQEFTAAKAARFMLNDMAIMHAATNDHAAGLIHMTRLANEDQQHLASGQYAKLSDDAKISVASRLTHQHYTAPGLHQGACQMIAASETAMNLQANEVQARMAYAFQQQVNSR